MPSRRNILLLVAGLLIFLSSVVCGFGLPASSAPAPLPTEAALAPESPGGEPTSAAAVETAPVPILLPTQAPTEIAPPQAPAPAAAIPESRRLTLEYPARIKTGDSDIIRLTLEVDTLGNITPTAETQGNLVKGTTVEVPNVYDTHTVIAEARLDLAGLEIRPGDVISEPLLPGRSVTFYWSVRPESSGTYRGTAWLFLRFIDKATGAESRTPLSAQTVTISTEQLLGLNGNLARTAGGIGSIVGAVLGFPFIDEVLKWLWKRIRGGA